MQDGSALDVQLFSFNSDSDGLSMESKLTIFTELEEQTILGTYKISIVETSPIDPAVTFETILTVLVETDSMFEI